MINPFGKIFIIKALVFWVLGLFFIFFKLILFSEKLPGDIWVQKENFTLYFPVASLVLLSIILSLVLFFLTRKQRLIYAN